MAARTLLQLRADVLTEADLTAGQVDDDDVTRLVNEQLGELYELLVQSFDGLFSTALTFTLVDADQGARALPTDLYQIVDLEDRADTTSPRSLPAIEFRDRNTTAVKGYCAQGTSLLVRPITQGPGTYRLTYTPSFTDLVADTDAVTYPQNWHQLAVLGAAIRLRNIQELSASGLEQRYADLKTRIQNAARKRQRHKVRDVRSERSDVAAWAEDDLVK